MAVYVFLAPVGHTNIMFSICNVVEPYLSYHAFQIQKFFLVCFPWKSGNPRAPGTYSMDAAQIWRAETWRVGDDDEMSHLPDITKEAPWKGLERKGPPCILSKLKATAETLECLKMFQAFGRLRLRIGVEGVPSPCIVGSNCSEANLFKVEFSVEL